MIISIWRPKTKVIDGKQIPILYTKCNIEEIYKPGSSQLRVIYKCDDINCKYPYKIYAINRCHLTTKRSKTINENVQICRSCQTIGDRNPKYGDNRTWEDIMGKDHSDNMKLIYKDKFIGDQNPSKCDNVKIKKGQIIINFENVKEQLSLFNLSLLSIDGVNKFSNLKIKCDKGHIFDIKWSTFKSKIDSKNICRYCYYESIRIPLDRIEEFEKYSKKIRLLTRSTFNKNRKIIDPKNLKYKNSKEYHIDHIYSIYDGFINKINPNIISSVYNLQILTVDDNLSKGKRSDIRLSDLLEKISIS